MSKQSSHRRPHVRPWFPEWLLLSKPIPVLELLPRQPAKEVVGVGAIGVSEGKVKVDVFRARGSLRAGWEKAQGRAAGVAG